MKYLKLFEQFSAEEAYEINEALKSSKLRSISKALYSDRDLLKKLYGTYALALDKITDDEVITMDPKTAYKDRIGLAMQSIDFSSITIHKDKLVYTFIK